jgi:hypothetical protein
MQNILTVHPEMGLAHRHLTVEPCAKGTKKDTRNIHTGYFTSLAPEDEDGNAVDDEDEYAIEATSITSEKGEETTASALVRNPSKKKNKKVSSVSQGSRADRLFNERVSKGKPLPTESKYNRPHEPKSVNPGIEKGEAQGRVQACSQGSGQIEPKDHQVAGEHDEPPPGASGLGDATTSFKDGRLATIPCTPSALHQGRQLRRETGEEV